MKLILTSQASSEMSKGKFSITKNLESKLPKEFNYLDCDYFIKCQELNASCHFPCQLQSFFDRYGIDRYLELGVGS